MNADEAEFSEQLRRYYASLSEEELLAMGRADLVAAAQTLYDDELGRRQLTRLAAESEVVPEARESVPFWRLDIRKAALLACISSVAASIIPARNFSLTMLAYQSEHPRLWTIPLLVVTSLVIPVMPLFYFALYRNQGALHFPRRLRLLALAGAFAMSLATARDLLGWIDSFGSSSVLMEARLPTAGEVFRLLVQLSGIAFILLLILIYRQPSHGSPTRASVSKLLVVSTKVAVITWGLWVTFLFVRLLATPFTYIQVRSYWSQLRQTPPSFGYLVWDTARMLLSQAGLLVAPYIVWRSISRPDGRPSGS